MKEIEAFRAVARSGRFNDAAASLGVSQSQISERVASLEQRLHHRLVSRTSRHVELTSSGRTFLIYADMISGLAHQARMQFERPPLQGPIRIGMVEDFALMGVLPRMLSMFRAMHPTFALHLDVGLSTSLFKKLDEGRLDIVVAKRLPGRENGRLLWREPLVWTGDETILQDRVAAIPMAVYPDPSETREVALRSLRKHARNWTIVTECESIAGLAAAAASGFGLATFSRCFVPDAVSVVTSDLLPPLGDVEYVIDQCADPRDGGVDAMVEILSSVATATYGVDAPELTEV